jgi:phosphatidylinositol glycan class B
LTATSNRRLIAGVLVLAALLRLPFAFVEMFHHPDEVWQYLEPAYGMVTGHQVVTWEYRDGMRSWLIPTLLALPIWLGKAAAPGTILYLRLARLVAVALSLLIVGYGTAIAARVSRLHGLVVGLVLATGFELLYFSARTLSDTIAVALFVPAAWALLPGRSPAGALLPDPARNGRRQLAGGLLLGLVVAARFQLGPAVALFALLCCGRNLRAWGLVVAGGVAGLAIDGLIDASHGVTPFAWMANNFRLNLVQGKSADYGTEPAWWYPVELVRIWSWAAVPILALALLGARRQPILLAVALFNIAVHSLIPHKEYRFVWLSSVLLLMLAGIGTADGLNWARARWPGRDRVIAGVAILFWLGAAVATATSKAGRAEWKGSGRSVALMRAEHDAAPGCAIAYYRPSRDQRAAYLYFDRPAPIAFLDQASAGDDLRRYGRAFDRGVAAPADAATLGAAYALKMCKYRPGDTRSSEQVCLYERPGPCVGTIPARLDVNAGFARQDR